MSPCVSQHFTLGYNLKLTTNEKIFGANVMYRSNDENMGKWKKMLVTNTSFFPFLTVFSLAFFIRVVKSWHFHGKESVNPSYILILPTLLTLF